MPINLESHHLGARHDLLKVAKNTIRVVSETKNLDHREKSKALHAFNLINDWMDMINEKMKVKRVG